MTASYSMSEAFAQFLGSSILGQPIVTTANNWIPSFELSQILKIRNRDFVAQLGTFLPGDRGMSESPLIAIVDDDELARDGIRQLVKSLGYVTTTFTSAEHFLQSAVVVQTTCLITDLQMPGKSGLELQEALRSQDTKCP